MGHPSVTEVRPPLREEKVDPFVKEQAAKLDKWHRNKVQPPGRRDLDMGPALPAEPAATPATVDVAVAEPVIVLTRDQYRQQVLLTMAVDRMLRGLAGADGPQQPSRDRA